MWLGFLNSFWKSIILITLSPQFRLALRIFCMTICCRYKGRMQAELIGMDADDWLLTCFPGAHNFPLTGILIIDLKNIIGKLKILNYKITQFLLYKWIPIDILLNGFYKDYFTFDIFILVEKTRFSAKVINSSFMQCQMSAHYAWMDLDGSDIKKLCWCQIKWTNLILKFVNILKVIGKRSLLWEYQRP